MLQPRAYVRDALLSTVADLLAATDCHITCHSRLHKIAKHKADQLYFGANRPLCMRYF